MVRHAVSKEVFRHASDAQCCDCGRACAQMIITALTQGVPAGTQPTPAQAAQPVPYRQDQLKGFEAVKIDTAGNWFTFPDEMHLLLQNESKLTALGFTDWRIADCATPDELFAWAAKSLQQGRPAVLNIREEDHWICAISVTYESGVLSLIEFLDPLLQAPRNPPAPHQHTYFDKCAMDGTVWLSRENLTPGELGSWEIKIGATPPTTYQGRCVGIVYGPPPLTPKQITAIGKKKRRHYTIKKPGPPYAEERVRQMLEELAIIGGIPLISQILGGNPQINLRTVRDLAHREKAYAIASVYAPELERGLLAVFDEQVETFFHLRLTSNKNLTDSIAKTVADEPLWWRRHGVPTLYSPYFPFQQYSDNGQTRYRRMIDGYQMDEG